jgi:hypothetical protein
VVMTATRTGVWNRHLAAVGSWAVWSLACGHLAYAGASPAPPQPSPPECAPCMEPSDGVIRIPCPLECRRILAARSESPTGEAPNEESCFKLPEGKAIVRLDLRPNSDVMDILSWLHIITCQPFLVPVSVRSRTFTVKTYRLLTVQECKYVFLAALNSVGLSVEEAGQSLRVVEVKRTGKSERWPGVLFSKFPLDRLTLIASAVGVRTRGVLRTPAGPPMAIRPGDRLSGASARVAEIFEDRVVFELPTTGSVDMDPSALMRITLHAPRPSPVKQTTSLKGALGPSNCDSVETQPTRSSPLP